MNEIEEDEEEENHENTRLHTPTNHHKRENMIN